MSYVFPISLSNVTKNGIELSAVLFLLHLGMTYLPKSREACLSFLGNNVANSALFAICLAHLCDMRILRVSKHSNFKYDCVSVDGTLGLMILHA